MFRSPLAHSASTPAPGCAQASCLTLSALAFAAATATPAAHAQTAASPATAEPAQAWVVATAKPMSVLPRVTVLATRFPERVDDLPFGVSVLTAQDIRSSGAVTVNDAIMKLLGVPGRQDSFGGGDYGLDLRGFGGTADSNQVIVLDGIRLNEADLGGTRLAGIPIESVDRIEVVRGSGAVLYGEGATGGVIVITTKAGSGSARDNRASVTAAAGSYGLRELRGNATLTQGEFSLDVAANKRDADNHRANFRSQADGVSLTGQWRNDWLRAGLRHAVDHLTSGLPGALSAAQYAADPSQASTPNDRVKINNQRTSVFAAATLGAWQLGLDAGWRDKALRSEFSGFPYEYDVTAQNQGVRAQHSGRIAGLANQFTAGVDHNEWQRTVLGDFGSRATQRSNAVYLKDELTLSTGTRLSAGWRQENIRKDNSSSTQTVNEKPQAWELGVVQPLSGSLAVFGRYGRSFRLANVDEFSFTTPNVTLKTQTSRDLDAGVRWTHPGGRGEVRVYRNALTNEIGYDPNAAGPAGAGANVNFDPTRRQGVELELQQALNAEVNLRLNAAVREATFESGPYAGKDVPLVPRQTLALRADWSPGAGHRFDAGVTWVASQHPDFANTCRMPSYVTTSARYAYQWHAAEFAVGVNNLGNRKFYTQAFSCTAGEATAIYPEAGRAVTLSARLQF